jgi:hypothetical protein
VTPFISRIIPVNVPAYFLYILFITQKGFEAFALGKLISCREVFKQFSVFMQWQQKPLIRPVIEFKHTEATQGPPIRNSYLAA